MDNGNVTPHEICDNVKIGLTSNHPKKLIEFALARVDHANESVDTSDDEIEIACTIARCKCLNDKRWTEEVFSLALDNADKWLKSRNDGVEIGSSIAEANNVYFATVLAKIAKNIASADILNNKEWARRVFKKSIAQYRQLSPANSYLFSDWYLDRAREIAQLDGLNDKAWVKEIVQDILTNEKRNPSNSKADTMMDIANFIADERYLNDTAWASQLVPNIRVFRDDQEVAIRIVECSEGAAETLLKLLKVASKIVDTALMEDASNPLAKKAEHDDNLAEIMADLAFKAIIGCTEWAERIFEIILRKKDEIAMERDVSEPAVLADEQWARAVCVGWDNMLNDIAWTSRVEEQASAIATPISDCEQIVDYIRSKVNGKERVPDNPLEMYVHVEDSNYLCVVAIVVAEGDRKSAKPIFRHAIKQARTPRELLTIAWNIASKNGLDDNQWALEVFDMALQMRGGKSNAVM